MNQRRAQFWVWWLLPVLAARALVPAGFMTAVASGNFKLVMCGESSKDAISSDRITTTKSVYSTKSQSHSSTGPSAPCLFAGSATALPVTICCIVNFDEAKHSVLIAASDWVSSNRQSAAHAIRGPPRFLS